MLHKLLRSPSFYIGLAVRFAAIALVAAPAPIVQWYAPFVADFLSFPTLDPWAHWLSSGGTNQAFPYGIGMLAVLSPIASLAVISQGLFPMVTAVLITLLIFDLALLAVLTSLGDGETKKSLTYYWLSPITIGATYILGFNDIIPVFFLATAVLLLRKNRGLPAGLLALAAISIKASMLLAVPVFIILFLKNRTARAQTRNFALGAAIGTAGLLLPFFALSPSAVHMIAENKEALRVWEPLFQLGTSSAILLVPLTYVLALYLLWSVKRLNMELFEAGLGLVFLMVVLSTASSAGWYVWVIPFFVAVKGQSIAKTGLLVWAFGMSYVLNFGENFLQAFGLSLAVPRNIQSGIHTMLFVTGVLLAIRIWRDGVKANQFFRISRKPFAIGISGDSGVGKDTFANAIVGIMGKSATSHLSGDDYHLWDRNMPMWKAVTHLNPAANDLTKFERDAIALLSGDAIQLRHYNHESGIYQRASTLRSNDFVLISGLHTLQLPSLSRMLDVSVFLDMNEGLRRDFKMRRDVYERGHSEEKVAMAIEKRAPDAQKYIVPQRDLADLIFTVDRENDFETLSQPTQTDQLQLSFLSRLGLDEQELRRALLAVSPVDFEINPDLESRFNKVIIRGFVQAEEVSQAASILCPNILDLADSNPKWESGVLGLMQLVFLCQLEHVLIRKAI